MTKAEIKKLIVDSDYKNKDVVIWWKWGYGESGNHDITSVATYFKYSDEWFVDYSTHRFSLDYLVETIWRYYDKLGKENAKEWFRFKVLEVGDD